MYFIVTNKWNTMCEAHHWPSYWKLLVIPLWWNPVIYELTGFPSHKISEYLNCHFLVVTVHVTVVMNLDNEAHSRRLDPFFFFSEEHKVTVTQIFPNIRKLWHIFPIKIFVRERINQPSYQQQCVQSYNSIAGASIYCIVKDKGNSGGLENGRHSSHFWKECEKNWPK